MADVQNSPGQTPGFTSELLDCWKQLPNKAFFLILLAAWFLLFQFLGNATFGYVNTSSLFMWMWNTYESGDGSNEHGFIIPIVVLVLFWLKRRELLAQPVQTWAPAMVMLFLAVALHVVGYVAQQPILSVVALFAGIYALMGLAWGPAWLKASFFPFFLFAFCVPVTSIAPLMGVNVQREGTQLFNTLHTYQYEVAAACSGLRSVIAIFCIATIYAFMSFDQHWKRGVLILSALPLAIISNVIRMLCIIVAAEVSGQAAGNYVHENFFFSLIPYIPAILGVMVIGRWLGGRKPPDDLTLEAKPA
jgi:exosortase/archaeosortase family protein